MNRKIIVIFLFMSLASYAQKNSDVSFKAPIQYALGIQNTYATTGVSVKVLFEDKHSLQFIAGVLNEQYSYSLRYAYLFKENGNKLKNKPYVYGQLGSYHKETSLKEKSFGTGLGIGIESYYIPFTRKLRASLDVGYQHINNSPNAIMLGWGLHYYLDL